MDNDESIAQIKNNFKYESEQQKVRTEKVNKDYLFNDERDKKNLAQSDNERLIQSLDHQHLNDQLKQDMKHEREKIKDDRYAKKQRLDTLTTCFTEVNEYRSDIFYDYADGSNGLVNCIDTLFNSLTGKKAAK